MSYFSLFQSPHPVRGATGSRSCWPPSQCHFNPRTPRGVRLAPHAGGGAAILISIHAPREGCDRMFTRYLHGRRTSIHAPREGCDQARSFQRRQKSRVSIHAPREGCDPYQCQTHRCEKAVSIHAPREGCDQCELSAGLSVEKFQSTHPARGATVTHIRQGLFNVVSIHAPREGCDVSAAPSGGWGGGFNPRTPRGVRRVSLGR